MTTKTQTAARLAGHELPTYAKRGIVLVRGRRATVWDANGRAYLDCAAGIGVANIGHANPDVAQAVAAQAERLITCPGSFDNDVRARWCERLAGLAPGPLSRVFLCNSGAEAVEAALKFARYATQRPGFVCAVRGFHGRTFGALSATHKDSFRRGFEPLLPHVRFVPFNDPSQLEQTVTEDAAAVLLEIVQGEGGVHVADGEYLSLARSLCERRGSLLIFDEVQTGFCRTGKMFACQHFGIVPDMLCLAKAIAGGLPMGAVVCGPKVPEMTGRHGSTFGGNPLCCAAALAAVGFMMRHRLDRQAARKGDYLLTRLRQLDSRRIREVRGLGLMIGIELRARARPALQALLDAGVIALPAGSNVLRLLPPLTISMGELDRLVSILARVLSG